MPEFMFATGIENSYPTIGLSDGTMYRVNEMAKTRHYECWREDFQLVKEMGIEHLRYGPPYYRCHLGPGRYAWSFADETFTALREMGITRSPISATSGCPTGSATSRIPIGPGTSRSSPERSPTAFPGLSCTLM